MNGGEDNIDGGVVDRRKLLIGGATAAGVMWVAPQINSIAAAGPLCSPSGCTPAALNLLSAAGFGAGTNITTGSRSFNGSTLTATRTNSTTITNGPGSSVGTSQSCTTGVIANAFFGNISGGQIPLCVAGNTNASVAITLNFNPGVRKLAFTITDIDSFDSSSDRSVLYREQVVIGGPGPAGGTGAPGAWTNGVGDAVATYPAIGSGLQGAGANRYQAASTWYNAPRNDATCNLGVLFDNCGTITSVTITSNDIASGTGTSPSAGRMVGITNLSWCV